ncbi:MAG: PilT/PilU family type 4a pilus ATPase [Candidatus Doudnabacteria bacterium]|nr:PilT/PilU family type 4a pilus ATPase [Candidatus Doudnabacteria bacterium]
MPLVEDKPLSVKQDKEIPKPGGVLDLQAKTPVLTEASKPQSAVPVTNAAPASNIQDDFDIVIGTEQKSNTESSSPIAESKNLVAPLLPAVQPAADSPLAPAVKSEAAGSTPQPAPAAKVQENLANISGVPEVKPVTPNEVKPVRKEEPKPLQISPKPAPRVSLPPLPSDVTVPQYEKEKLNQLEADVKISSESGSKLVTKEYSLDEILRQAVNAGASDVHLNANYRAVARVNGKLLPLQSEVLSSEKIKKMVGQVIGNHRDVDMDSVLDLDLAYVLPNSTARFRVNVYKERDSHAAVFRLIPERIQTIEELGLPPLLREFLTLEQGLVLVTGATGSGKSTTIATLVNEINLKQPKHIVTIEDPIEYVYPVGNAVVSQRAVNSDTESWAAALRSVLRQDPDVVVIGEMRDLETISAALRVAETGHLVFGTLHTNSAAQSVDRIIDVFPEYQQNQIRTQLANVLTAVVSQKLVPVAGGRLRVAVEIMLVNSAVRAAIRENRVYQIDNMIQTSAEEGMISMEKSLIEFVHQGLISPEVAQQFANKPSDLLALLR